MHETTLHLSPCKVNENGFKTIMVLLKGKNMKLREPVNIKEEDGILLMKNKWNIAHEERAAHLKRGISGLIGENVQLHY